MHSKYHKFNKHWYFKRKIVYILLVKYELRTSINNFLKLFIKINIYKNENIYYMYLYLYKWMRYKFSSAFRIYVLIFLWEISLRNIIMNLKRLVNNCWYKGITLHNVNCMFENFRAFNKLTIVNDLNSR